LVVGVLVAIISVSQFNPIKDPEVTREINSFFNKSSAKTS